MKVEDILVGRHYRRSRKGRYTATVMRITDEWVWYELYEHGVRVSAIERGTPRDFAKEFYRI